MGSEWGERERSTFLALRSAAYSLDLINSITISHFWRNLGCVFPYVYRTTTVRTTLDLLCGCAIHGNRKRGKKRESKSLLLFFFRLICKNYVPEVAASNFFFSLLLSICRGSLAASSSFLSLSSPLLLPAEKRQTKTGRRLLRRRGREERSSGRGGGDQPGGGGAVFKQDEERPIDSHMIFFVKTSCTNEASPHPTTRPILQHNFFRTFAISFSWDLTQRGAVRFKKGSYPLSLPPPLLHRRRERVSERKERERGGRERIVRRIRL